MLKYEIVMYKIVIIIKSLACDVTKYAMVKNIMGDIAVFNFVVGMAMDIDWDVVWWGLDSHKCQML